MSEARTFIFICVCVHAMNYSLIIIQFLLRRRSYLWMLIMALGVNLVCLMWVRSHYCTAACSEGLYLSIFRWGKCVFPFGFSPSADCWLGHSRDLVSCGDPASTVRTFDPTSCRCPAQEKWSHGLVPPHQMSWSLIGWQNKLKSSCRLKHLVHSYCEVWGWKRLNYSLKCDALSE